MPELSTGHSPSGPTDRSLQLRLGSKPLVLPPPLDALVLDLVDRRHGCAVVGISAECLNLGR